MALVPCPDCGKQVSDQAKACPSCARPFAVNAEVVRPKKIKVIEFQNASAYASWLKFHQGGINVISVATTKRWGWTLGFLGRAKTYTFTYELLGDTKKSSESALAPQFWLILFLIGAAAFIVWIAEMAQNP